MQRTSSRCFTFLTNMFPSAAKPLTARTALSVLPNLDQLKIIARDKHSCSQSEYLGCIARLYAVALGLASVARDDRKVLARNGKNRPTVLGVRVEAAFGGLYRGGHRLAIVGWDARLHAIS